MRIDRRRMARDLLVIAAIVAPFWIGAYLWAGWRGVGIMALAAIGAELAIGGFGVIRRAWRISQRVRADLERGRR